MFAIVPTVIWNETSNKWDCRRFELQQTIFETNLYFRINILYNSLQHQMHTSDFNSDTAVYAELYLVLLLQQP
jgi:hypothetical protein